MDNTERLTREELISRICVRRQQAKLSVRGSDTDFPVFGEREQRDFEASLWPIRIFDCETLRYLAVNDAALRLYGYTREEFLALTPLDTRHPDELDDVVGALSEYRSFLRYLGTRWHLTKSRDAIAVDVVAQDILFNRRWACLSLTIDVTDRARMLERLHQSNQAVQAMVENGPDITARFDRDLRHVYVSSAVTELTGLSPAVFIGKTNQELAMPAELVTLWDRSLTQVFDSGREQRIEFSCPSPTGVRYFDTRIVPEFNMDRKVNTVLSVARDITERKKSELTMQHTLALTQLLGSLARAANEAITPETAMSTCLELICKHGNWALGRVIIFELGNRGGAPTRSIWFAPDQQRFVDFIRISADRKNAGQGDFVSRAVREQEPAWIEDLQQTPKFNRRLLAVRHGIKAGFAFPIVVQGKVVAVIELLATQRRPRDSLMVDAAQTIASQLSRLVERESAHRSNARLAAIVASSQDAIILRAVDDTILTWNAGAERLFGYTAAEIVGRSIGLLVPEELRQESANRRERTNHGEVFEAFETVRVGKGGRRIDVSVAISQIRNAEGAVVAISTVIRDISRQKHAERELQRQKKLLDAIIQNLPVSVVVKDATTLRLMMVNRVAEEMSTLRMEKSIGKTAHELFPEAQANTYLQTDQRALQSRQMVEIAEQTVIGIAGDVRIRHTRKVPIFTEEGEPWVLVGIGEDITDRKSAEYELQRQKKLLDTIIEHLPVGITVKDAYTRRYLLRNRLANELTGCSNTEAIGKRADELYSPELAALIHASDLEALASGGAVIASPLIVQSASGRVVRNLKVPVPDESKRYAHIVTILDDLTDFEQAQIALRRSEQRLNQLISMSPAAIFSISLDRPPRTTFISENVRALVGWTPSDFTGSPLFWSEHVHPDDWPLVRDAVSRIAQDGKYHCEYRFLHKDGNWRWMRDAGRTVCDEAGVAYEAIGSWTDVTTEHEEAETRLRRALLQRDTLVREVHHRIKNNIQGVIGLLRRKVKTQPGSAAEIEEAIMQLQTIAMVYGLQGKVPSKPLSLAAMLDSICILAENLSGKGVVKTYQSTLRQPLCVVVEEAVAVAVALNELVFNALKHQTTGAGKEEVRIAVHEGEDLAELRIVNRGRLPPQFDFKQGHGVNEGLDLVKALLLQPGSDVTFCCRDGEVEVVLNLRPPLLATQSVADATSG